MQRAPQGKANGAFGAGSPATIFFIEPTSNPAISGILVNETR
jgi:hypothetical protein